MDVCTAGDGMGVVDGFWRIGMPGSNLLKELRANRSTSPRLLSRKKSRNFRTGHLESGLAMELSSTGREDSGCAGHSECVGMRSGTCFSGIVCDNRKGNWVSCDGYVRRAKRQLESGMISSRLFRGRNGKESEDNREVAVGLVSTVAPAELAGTEDCKLRGLLSLNRTIISAAAVAGLSFTLCSTALADPVITHEQIHMPAKTVTEEFRMYVESQARRELREQIKEQEEWLDGIGQPLNQWTIDDRVRKILEDRARSRLDESGNAVSVLDILESEVVPVFKPPSVMQNKAKAAHVGISTQEAVGNDDAIETRKSSLSRPLNTAKTALDEAPEVLAVAAIPLGSVVSAASRTVGSAVSAAAIEVSTAVPRSLFNRIMMHFGGGGIAGALGATIVYPLDTIKTRMQAQSSEHDEEGHFENEWDCLRQLVAKEGLGSLYSGIVPQLFGIAPEKAMKLTVNEILMEMLETSMPGVGAWALELIAGGGGGFSQVVFTNPMEILKVRLQTQSKESEQKNTWDVMKELGVKGLYNGSLVTMARDIPSSAIFFAIYTLIRQVYPDHSFLAGFLAAVPATVLVTPFDVVKTRLQMERAAEEEYENGYECFLMILQKEGVRALFKGSLARVLKTGPQFGITLMLYNALCNGS